MDILLEKERAMGGDERSLWANMDPDMHGLYVIICHMVSHGLLFCNSGVSHFSKKKKLLFTSQTMPLIV